MAEAKVSNDLTIEERLRALYNLQKVDSEIDKIKILRGELPLEVQDLEDEIEGLHTRIEKIEAERQEKETAISDKKIEIKEAEALIKKYEEQQNNVRNNREFDALSKEIEFQNLEIEFFNKNIKDFGFKIEQLTKSLENSQKLVEERLLDLKQKKDELEAITQETEKEEAQLKARSEEYASAIDNRLVTAYKRIREKARNGLAVVLVERDACGGCFNKIPPQRQLDIRMRNKVTVCEYCGRVLVDKDIEISMEELEKRLQEERALEAAKQEKRAKRRTSRAKKADK